MDWGELLGKALEGLVTTVGGTSMMMKWMEINDPTSLRFTIRSDIRGFTPETVRMMSGALSSSINNFNATGDRKLRDRATMVREILIEEAERKFG